MSTLTWLHLSDLHYWEKRTGWDAYQVLQSLVADLRGLESHHGLLPDYLFFTGDAAFGHVSDASGDNISDQFAGARRLLEQVQGAFSTPIPKLNTFIVPGNHDVRRSAVLTHHTYYLDNGATLDDVVRSMQSAGDDWKDYMKRLADYRDFLRQGGYEHLLTDEKRLIYHSIREVGGRRLGIVGLNSAWSCCRESKEEKGKLWLGGKWQIGHLRPHLAEADLTIALIHHPGNWFREAEDPSVTNQIGRDFTFHLHGHEHQGWLYQDAETGHVRVAAAACYQGSSEENGYNVVRVNLDTGEADVWFRRFDDQGGGWIPRAISGRTDPDGHMRLAGKVLKRTILDITPPDANVPSGSVTPTTAAGVPSDLLSLLERVTLAAKEAGITVPLLPESTGHYSGDQAAQSRIDAVNRLLNDCRPVAADAELSVLRTELWPQVSAQLRAKIANNQGVASLQMDDLPAALRYFEEALGWEPVNAKILTNVAQMALISGKPQDALDLSEKALRLDRLFEDAAAVWIQALHSTGNGPRLEAALALDENRWMSESSASCQAAQAFVAFDRGEFERAEGLLRRVLEHETNRIQLPHHYTLLAKVIVTPIERRANGERRMLAGSLTEREAARLEEAAEAYSRAVEMTEGCDCHSWLHSVLVSRAGVLHTLGSDEEALRDCERVLGERPDCPAALEAKGRILLDTKRPEEAAVVLEALARELGRQQGQGLYVSGRADEERHRSAQMLLCEAYLNSSRAEKVPALLGRIAPPGRVPSSTADLWKAEMTLYAAAQMHGEPAERAKNDALDFLRAVDGDDHRVKLILSNFAEQTDDIDGAISLQGEALLAAPEPTRNSYRIRLAQLLYRQGRFAEAAEHFRPAVAGIEYHPALHPFTVALFNVGLYAEALDAARRVRAKRGILPGIAEIEATVLEQAGDLDAALDLWKRLAEAYPQELQFLVRAAFLEFRLGHAESAEHLASQIAYEAAANDANLLLNAARLRQVLGMPDVLRFAYRARRIAFNDPEIHADYMKLGMHMPPDSEEAGKAFREREAAGIGDAVTVSRNGAKTTFILEEDGPFHADRGEIGPADPRAERLIGARKGDRVALRESLLGPDECDVEEIRSKFLHASEETTQMFQDGRLDLPTFAAFEASSPDFAERFWRFLEQRSDGRPDIGEMYRTQPLPLAAVARLSNRPVLEVWLAMTSSPASTVFAFRGDPLEVEGQCGALGGDTPPKLSLDITALLTLAHTGMEEALTRGFSEVLVARPILDELLQNENDLEHVSAGSGYAGSDRGRPFFVETPAEELERRRRLVGRALDFVRSAATVVPVMGILEADADHLRFVGSATMAGILAAVEYGAVLYCDDLRLREMAFHLFQVSGVDSQAVLAGLHRRGMVTGEEHYTALAELARLRYHFVSMNVDGIMAVLDKSGYSLTPAVAAAFSTFEGPDSDQETAIGIMAEVIKRVFLMKLLSHQKATILDVSLSTLVKGRRMAQVISQLVTVLPHKFVLVPHIRQDVLNNINLWVQVRRRTLNQE